MSYSFTAKGASRAAAKAEVAAKLDEVVNGQPVHAGDRAQAQAAADAFVDLLREPDATEQVIVNMHGSVWQEDGTFKQTSVSVNATVGKKEA